MIKLKFELLILILSVLLVGITFSFGMLKPEAIIVSIMHSLGIIFWSFFNGNGIIWLVGMFVFIWCYFNFNDHKYLYAQLVISIVLGLSCGAGWYVV